MYSDHPNYRPKLVAIFDHFSPFGISKLFFQIRISSYFVANNEHG
jgi:hypothetical protein